MGDTVRLGRRARRKRPVLPLILAAIAALLVAVGSVALALRSRLPDSSGTPTSSAVQPAPSKTLPQSFIDRNTASEYIMLENVTTGQVLYSKNAEAKCYPASLTKLMTAIVACENLSADTAITVGDEIRLIDPESSRAYLTVGSRLTMEQLIEAMLLPSGNDAAYALAAAAGRRIANNDSLGNVDAIRLFCTKMNEKAQALGCTGTHFSNSDGIHAEDHYTTAADMLKIATYALQQDIIARTVCQPQVTVTMLSGQTVTWKNSNKLVREDNAFTYAGATGLKTGSTNEAGYCLIASATRDGQTSIAVVMGAKQESNRWEDASGLLDISFQ